MVHFLKMITILRQAKRCRLHKPVQSSKEGTCVSVCMAGGEKEVEILASQLRMASKFDGTNLEIAEETIQRQCDKEYIKPIVEKAKNYEVVLSMACGAGVQLVADLLEPIPVIPALNTRFIGVTEAEGVWVERCQACGNCMLDKTGGICPVTRCAKSLLNGPCGGSVEGKCEVSPDTPCAWQMIMDRLKALGQLEKLEEIVPPQDWSVSCTGGPRKLTVDN